MQTSNQNVPSLHDDSLGLIKSIAVDNVCIDASAKPASAFTSIACIEFTYMATMQGGCGPCGCYLRSTYLHYKPTFSPSPPSERKERRCGKKENIESLLTY